MIYSFSPSEEFHTTYTRNKAYPIQYTFGHFNTTTTKKEKFIITQSTKIKKNCTSQWNEKKVCKWYKLKFKDAPVLVLRERQRMIQSIC